MLLMPRLGLFAFLCWIVIIFVAAGFPAWLLGQPGFSSPCGRFSSPGKWVGASPPGQPPAIGNMKTPSCLATDISSMFHLRWRSSWFLWTWSVRVVSRGGPQVLGSSWKVVSIVPIQAIRKSDTSTCARGENVGICWRHLDLHLILRPVSRKDFYHNVCIGCQRKADAHGNFYHTQLSTVCMSDPRRFQRLFSHFCTDQSEKGSSWSCKRTQWPVSLQNRYLPHIWMFASLIHYRQSPKPTLQNVQNTLHLGKVHLFLKLPLRLLPLFPPTLPQVLRRLYLGSMFECLMFKFNKNQKVVKWFYLVAMFWCFLWIPQSRCS